MKPFVAVVTLQLVEAGLFSLDDPLPDVLPDNVTAKFANSDQITVRMLLNHTSGIPEFLTETVYVEIATNPAKIWTDDEWLDIAAAQTPYFAPGQGWQYANTNYILIGLVIQQATGRSWRQEVRERVIKPLNLGNTLLPEPGDLSLPGNHSRGYHPMDGALIDITGVDPSMAGAAGGSALVTTASDLARFLNAVLVGELFQNAETLDEMLTFVKAQHESGLPYYYGLGMAKWVLEGGIEMMGHSGGTAGFVSAVYYLPALNITIAAMTNTSDPWDFYLKVFFPAIEVLRTAVSERYDHVFFMQLASGLNMVSLPLKPRTPYNARSFAEMLNSTVVIKLDEASQRFVGFTLDAPDDGFAIEGGKGYIVNVPEGRVIPFTGAAWTNQPPAEASPSLAQSDGAWAFVVSGRFDVEPVANLFHVTVRNTRTNVVTTDVARSGYFAAAFADLTRKNVVEVGDQLEVTVRTDEFVSEPFVYTVTPENIRQAFLPIILKNVEIPRQSLLLQNYPNPFNPETWIPYQIKEPVEVAIRIYNLRGQLVCTLNFGHRKAGFYLGRSRAAYWDGTNNAGEKVASGAYFYQIQAGEFSATRKMFIAK
jgi:D-alanyl-D-alanine carboxypeptidase